MSDKRMINLPAWQLEACLDGIRMTLNVFKGWKGSTALDRLLLRGYGYIEAAQAINQLETQPSAQNAMRTAWERFQREHPESLHQCVYRESMESMWMSGYSAALSASPTNEDSLPVAVGSGWTDVKDGLPKVEGKYLCSVKGQTVQIVTLAIDDDEPWWVTSAPNPDDITAWMPIPLFTGDGEGGGRR